MTDPTPTTPKRRTTKAKPPVEDSPVAAPAVTPPEATPVEAAKLSPEAYAYQGPPGRQVCPVCHYQRRRGMEQQDICPPHPEHPDCPRAPQTEGFNP